MSAADGAAALDAAGRARLPSTMPAPHAESRMPYPTSSVSSVSCRVDDLDRDDQGEEHDRQRLAAEQATGGDGFAPRVAQALASGARRNGSRVRRSCPGGPRHVARTHGDDGEGSPRRRARAVRDAELRRRAVRRARRRRRSRRRSRCSAAPFPARSWPAGCRTALTAPREMPARGEHQDAVEQRQREHQGRARTTREQREEARSTTASPT